METVTEQIHNPDHLAAAQAELDEADRQEILNTARRVEMMHKIAQYRWWLATNVHELANGEKLDFERWPFQEEMYKSDAQYLVLMGATGWGKSVFLVVDDIARAAIAGFRVIHVLEKTSKRDTFVKKEIDPVLHRVEYYKHLMKAAAKEKAAEADSISVKQIGDGEIIFLGAKEPSDFFTHRGESTTIDEHQLCDQENLRLLFNRRAGTFYRFQVICGNPTTVGSDENHNLHWEYMTSDQRRWHVPCPYCRKMQVLGWWSHFVDEEKNEFGAILSVEPKDKERKGQRSLEIRPICIHCQKPMRRLVKRGQGAWIAMNPGSSKRGYQLSNIYNPDVSMNDLYERYISSLHDPTKMADFWNNQLGEPYASSGTNFTTEMLEQASTGRQAGVPPYQFEIQSNLNLKKINLDEFGDPVIADLPSGSMGLPLQLVVPPCIAGIDVRPGSYDVIIADVWTSSLREQRVVRPVFIAKLRTEKEATYIMRQYGVRYGIIDARPEADLALRCVEECEKYNIELWRSEYMTQPSTLDIVTTDKHRLLKLERTITLTFLHHCFTTGLIVTLPRNYKHITGGQFLAEMCSSTKTPTRWHGRDYQDWQPKGPDHALHAFNMLMVAAKMSGMLRAGFGNDTLITTGIVQTTLNQPGQTHEICPQCRNFVLISSEEDSGEWECPVCGAKNRREETSAMSKILAQIHSGDESDSLVFEA